MSFSIQACKQFAGDLSETMDENNVAKYKTPLEAKINDICLEIGYLQESGKSVDKLLTEFEKNITFIAKDESEQNKLRAYGNRVVELGELYFRMNVKK